MRAGKQGEMAFEELLNHLTAATATGKQALHSPLSLSSAKWRGTLLLGGQREGHPVSATQGGSVKRECNHSGPFSEFLRFPFLTSNLTKENNMQSDSNISTYTYR